MLVDRRDVCATDRECLYEVAQRQLLEALVTGMPLEQWLERVCLLFESVFAGTYCSVQLVENGWLLCMAAPSLPQTYREQTQRVPIGPCVGSCGTAAYRNRLVIVEDIEADPNWRDYRTLALSHGLRACWSLPIRDASQHVVGTFAVYCREPRGPQSAELAFLERWTYLVSLAVQRFAEQRALAASRESFQKLIDGAPEAIVLFDPELGTFVRVNPAAERLFGLPAEVLLRLGLMDVSPEFQPDGERSRERARRYIDAALAGGQPVFEWTHVNSQGEPFVAEVRLLAMTWEGRRLVRGCVVDVTERKRLEEQLAQELAFVRAMMDSVPCTIFLFDSRQRMLRWNRKAEEASGYSHEEISRTPALAFVAPEDQGKTQRAIEEAFLKGHASVEAHLLTKSGKRIPYFYQGVRLEMAQGPCLLGVGVDMSSQKEIEEQLRQADKMGTVGRLAAGIAHDFNNLLTVILGYSELLLGDNGTAVVAGEASREFVKCIRDAAERGKSLTSQLLAFGRQTLMEMRLADLNTVILQARALITSIVGKAVEVELRLDSSPVYAKIDVDQVTQLLLNLASNSGDAMPNGGKLIMETRRTVVEEQETKSDLLPGHYAMLVVSDTGTGIPEEIQSRVFDPFFTTKPTGRGTGLGLPVVHGIVKQHGGHIQLSSQPGKGTTVTIYFPSEAPPHAEKETQRPTGELLTHVLVVDDESVVRQYVARVLEFCGYRVTSASDAEEALDLIENGLQFDVMVTDLAMPGKNGRELAEELARRRPGTPVLFISGYTEDAAFRQGLLDNHVQFLAKPFTPAALVERIRAMVEALN